ncbi:CGG triplet repeat-binding protein 1-like [Heterodontus francisci]|uniref:CGG triplet repeat-binding protein 1-like n=1 Tax=Heterodontus francisci TaxID=7792 RepID=UPI00355AFC91
MATTITAAYQMKEFGRQILHADGGIMFCRSFNVSLNHTQQATVQHGLESKNHHSRKRASDTALPENKHANKQTTISSLFQKLTDSSENHQLVTMELVDAFASAHIPLDKPDHPKLWVFIQQNVQNVGCLPSANKLRQDYLPKVFATHCGQVKSQINAFESPCSYSAPDLVSKECDLFIVSFLQ